MSAYASTSSGRPEPCAYVLGIRPVVERRRGPAAAGGDRTPGRPYLGGDDPIFGFRTRCGWRSSFDGEKLGDRTRPRGEMNILVGTGAALAGWQGELVYIDIPKNEIQFRSRAGSIANLGLRSPNPEKMYKRFYFV